MKKRKLKGWVEEVIALTILFIMILGFMLLVSARVTSLDNKVVNYETKN